MKQESVLEDIESKITKEYRKVTRLMLRKESIQLETPSAENGSEILELKGYLKGLKKGLAIVSEKRNDHEFPSLVI